MRRVDADTVRAATGFPIGGVPPFGHATELAVFVDPDLLAYDEVWAAAGTWHDVFALSPADLVRVSGGTVVDLTLQAPFGDSSGRSNPSDRHRRLAH